MKRRIRTIPEDIYKNPFEYALSWELWWDSVKDGYSPYVLGRHGERKSVSRSEYKNQQRKKWIKWSQKRRHELIMEGKL